MPHDDSTRRLVALAMLGLCVISLRLVWGVSGEFPINLGTPGPRPAGRVHARDDH